MKLPKTLFVKMEKEGDTTYPVADTSLVGLAEMGEKLKIGVYTLTETIEAEGVVSRRRL